MIPASLELLEPLEVKDSKVTLDFGVQMEQRARKDLLAILARLDGLDQLESLVRLDYLAELDSLEPADRRDSLEFRVPPDRKV